MSRLSLVGSLPVAASPERAWELFSRVEDWSRWDWVGSADARWLAGEPWSEGARLRVGHRPWTFDCTVVRARPPAEVIWEGTGAGIHGRHRFSFLPHPRGCLVETAEVFTGPGARRLKPLIHWFWWRQLRALRRHVERAEPVWPPG